MRTYLGRLAAVLSLLVAAAPVDAQLIGRAVTVEPEIYVSFTQLDPDYDIPGDMFGIRSRDFPDAPECLQCPGIPFTMVDDTNNLFTPRPTDRLGIIRSEDYAPFFGVVDTINGTGDNLNTAVWTFDIRGYTEFRISADMAAMGDFEAGDIERPRQDAFVFDYSIDGGPYEILFISSVDEDASQDYEMELPHPDNPIITLDDPLAMNGITLNNVFQTLSTEFFGAGSQLELRFRAIADGNDEAFAFRNLIIEAIDEVIGGLEGTGDYNGNGTVEQADLDLVLLNWGHVGPPPAGWINDLPRGAIDQEELDGVLLNWGNSSGAGLATPSVPEPETWLIALLATLAFHVARKRLGWQHVATVIRQR